MTFRRVAGPSPRTVALPTASRVLLVGLLLAFFAVACGSAGPSASVGQPAPSGSAAAGANPTPPRWPGTTVLAVIALGAADGEIRKAGDDLQAAAAKQDLKAMWGAADGLARMIDGLMPNLERLEVYAGTSSIAAQYRASFPDLAAGAKLLRDSITKGDSAGVVAGSQQIARGLAAYAPIRREIAGLVEQAIVQQRLYLK